MQLELSVLSSTLTSVVANTGNRLCCGRRHSCRLSNLWKRPEAFEFSPLESVDAKAKISSAYDDWVRAWQTSEGSDVVVIQLAVDVLPPRSMSD